MHMYMHTHTNTHLQLLHPLMVLQPLLLSEFSGRVLLPHLELGQIPLSHLTMDGGLASLTLGVNSLKTGQREGGFIATVNTSPTLPSLPHTHIPPPHFPPSLTPTSILSITSLPFCSASTSA